MGVKMENMLVEVKEKMSAITEKMNAVFLKLNIGKANVSYFDDIKIDYYGVFTPIRQLCNISIPEARLAVIQPWDKTTLPLIEKAILTSNIGITPENDGTLIRLPFPTLTQEKRVEVVKQVKKMAEEAKIAIRNKRRDANEELKKSKKDGSISEDEQLVMQKKVQKETDNWIEKIEEIAKNKEEDIMKI